MVYMSINKCTASFQDVIVPFLWIVFFHYVVKYNIRKYLQGPENLGETGSLKKTSWRVFFYIEEDKWVN